MRSCQYGRVWGYKSRVRPYVERRGGRLATASFLFVGDWSHCELAAILVKHSFAYIQTEPESQVRYGYSPHLYWSP